MPAPRLNDSQKEELVDRYRQGETAQALAAAFGCSPNTVSRVLKAALDPAEMEAIKRQSRGRTPVPVVADPIPEAEASPAQPESEEVVFQGEPEPDQTPTPAAADEDEPTTLAIDDADDFGDDGLDDSDGDDDSDEADADPLVAADPAVVVEAKPLIPGALPASVYMLVDKTVELQPRPLAEFTELGSLPEDEQALQALMLYTNPRQAKRQCGRTQRVIKVPDAGVLERRSSYLVAQGITRLVVEGGALFALAGN
ncbi:MAG: hypothetical protein KXJ49_02795 [Vulcanococcus sp.]|uniref:helix-turn-helix domain-containing protein n=1 Tax=Vulcanococcus sp. TaxID=2856995 RepID=UPI0025CBA491|nr:helix-turn-helix domain-containing protein [Vulcanococcus sp.]MBW0166407.1 hypothetical protein [Vulcanococcus sp.]